MERRIKKGMVVRLTQFCNGRRGAHEGGRIEPGSIGIVISTLRTSFAGVLNTVDDWYCNPAQEWLQPIAQITARGQWALLTAENYNPEQVQIDPHYKDANEVRVQGFAEFYRLGRFTAGAPSDLLPPDKRADRELAALDLPPHNLISAGIWLQNFGGVYTIRYFDAAARKAGDLAFQSSDRAKARAWLINYWTK